jgi:hypothetical protein
MTFFNGFLLKNEEKFFLNYLKNSHFTVAGFSYGAILAYEYALENINIKTTRIDTLQLFSPAFFDISDKKFTRTQLFYFSKDEQAYKNNFLQNIFYPENIQNYEIEQKHNTKEDLEKLLTFDWSAQANNLEKLTENGIKLEIYLGEKDKIVDSKKAFDFFKQYGETCFLKNRGHLLI